MLPFFSTSPKRFSSTKFILEKAALQDIIMRMQRDVHWCFPQVRMLNDDNVCELLAAGNMLQVSKLDRRQELSLDGVFNYSQ